MGKLKNKIARPGFSRPIANMSNDVIREWRNTTIDKVQMDDIIAGMGKVNILYEACDGTFYVEAGEDTEDFFDASTPVFAFVRKDN